MKRKIIIVCVVMIAIVAVSVFARREFITYQKHRRINDFQSIMLDLKEMRLNQGDGKYIAFGDSIIQAMSPYALDEQYVNMGVGGYTVSQIHTLLSNTNTENYAAIIIEGGINDALGNARANDIAKQYLLLIDELKGKQVLLLQTLPVSNTARKNAHEINQKVIAINKIITGKCESQPGCIAVKVPPQFNTKASSKLYMPDGVHLNAHGYHVWANAIKAHL